MLTAQIQRTEGFMARQGGSKTITPDDVLTRLWDLEKAMGLPTATDFARHIGIQPTSITPQKLWNWRNGKDRIGLETFLLLKPSVRALLLLERPEDEELFAEGMRAGYLAARQAVNKEFDRLLASDVGASELGRDLIRSRQQLAAALEEEQTGPKARKRQAGSRRPSKQ